MADSNDVLYVVWGPTAEWADGSGPLGWFATHDDADSFIEEEKKFISEEGFLDTWPYNVVDYWIEEWSVSRLVEDGAITAEEAGSLSIEEIVEVLNSYF